MGLLAINFMFAQPGTLDATFGTEGYSLFGPAGALGDGNTNIATQPDGKIVCAGVAQYTGVPNATSSIIVTRFNANGSPDNTFATIITSVGLENDAWVEDIALQSDGKIVITGYCYNPDTGVYIHSDVFIIRCNSNGGLDTTFGNGGKFTYNIGMSESQQINTHDYAHALAVQPDGGVIIVGQVPYVGSMPMPFALRVNNNGILDSSFGTNGIVVLNFSEFYPGITALYQFATGVALQEDGKIVLAGKAGEWYTDFAVARLNPNGTLDSSFGTGGKAIVEGPFLDNVNFLLQPDGKLLLSAKGTDEGLLYHKVVRLSNNGSPDTGFGINGTTNVSISPNIHMGNIALQANGKIVTIDNNNQNMQTTLLLSRLNADGTLDTDFGTNGHSALEFPEFESCVPYDLSIQENNKIIGGLFFKYPGSASQIGVMRFNGGEIMGVNELANGTFSIYPNPATNILNILNPENTILDGVSIIDITGKIIMHQTGNTSQIDVQNLSPGIYFFLKISSEGKEYQHKFIKQ